MSTTYAGDPTSFPVDYVIPDDSDPPTAAAFNPAIEALGDRTAWLKNQLPYLASTTVTTTGSVVVPDGATHAFYEGCGGGGGGGGGGLAAGSNRLSPGGGGGGGAVLQSGLIEVTAGWTLTVTIGAGGTAGPGGTSPDNGGDGGDTTIAHGATTLATMMGAAGGTAGGNMNQPITDGSLTFYVASSGGSPTRGVFNGIPSISIDSNALLNLAPHVGGRGRSGNSYHVFSTERGGSSPQGHLGGTSGLAGSFASTYLGGGGGGGGGASPYGAGGAGGNGGNGNSSGSGGTGAAGGAGGPAAGGGGGGASGGSNTGGGSAGAGATGGSGRVTITFLRTV